jgi:transglutaminase-like putative cysteine protease
VKLHKLFRISTHVCLGFSTLCLGHTERNEIDGVLGFYLVATLAVLAAYLAEDRWLMPRRWANTAAVGILLGWLGWLAVTVGSAASGDDASTDLIQWVLPRSGPLLGLLLISKLFLPKTSWDYWLLHGLGLMQIVLACVLALTNRLDREDAIFGLLLLGYVISGVWGLLLFYHHRESPAGRLDRPPPGATPGPDVPWRTYGVPRSLGWFFVSLALALLVFFVVPRPGRDASGALFFTGKARAETGFSPGMDLNDSGPLEVSDEEVMIVEAHNVDGQPITLPQEQRFRGMTCSYYVNGRWRPALAQTQFDRQPVTYTDGANLLPGLIRLTYHLDLARVSPTSVAGPEGDGGLFNIAEQPLFLAEPLYLWNRAPATTMAVTNLRERAGLSLHFRSAEVSLLTSVPRRPRKLVYYQHQLPPSQTNYQWSAPFEFPPNPVIEGYVQILQRLPDRLIASGRIAAQAQDILKKSGVKPDAGPEQKARALENYLSNSGEYAYTLDRQRLDLSLDPTEDFLLNVKQGHCELFASALALMLRAEGIPARVVIGFRGWEWNERGEFHSVRQYHAHAWVEALIGPRGGDGWVRSGRWLTLDPAPGGATAGLAGGAGRRGWTNDIQFARFLWEFFILDYTGDMQRERLLARFGTSGDWQRVRDFFSRLAGVYVLNPWGKVAAFAGLAAVLLGVYWLRRWVVRRRQEAALLVSRVGFYTRLLRLLERAGLRPRPSQTAAEFGRDAGEALGRDPRTAAVAAIPAGIAEAFYTVRYADRQLPPDQAAAVERDLDRLHQTLKQT